MSRRLSFMLLLATVVALSYDRSEAQQAAGAAKAQAKAGAAQGQTEPVHAQAEKTQRPEETQAKTGAAQGQTRPSQTQADKAQIQTGEAQPKTGAAQGQTEPAQAQPEEKAQGQTDEAQAKEDAKLVSVPGGKALGMSILGNQEAPKALVIVPWKTSELGRAPGITPMLDDARQPVDKEVFMRALRFYEIRSEKKP